MSRLPLLLVAVSLGACIASNGTDGGMLVSKNVVPGDGCTFSSTENETIIPAGTVQIHFPYYAFPQIKSRITATDDQLDQRTIITREANIDLEFQDPDMFDAEELDDLKTNGVTHFKELLSVPVQPNGGISDASFIIIPTSVSDAIEGKLGTVPATFQTTILAKYTIHGDMSGETVDSNEFQFPVTVVGAGLLDSIGACPVATGTVVRPGNSCNPGQDTPVDCCTSGTSLVCPAPTSGS